MKEALVKTFNQLPIRVHSFLEGIPIHSLDLVQLSGGPRRMTISQIDSILQFGAEGMEIGWFSDAMFRLRTLIGKLMRWEDAEHLIEKNTFLKKLTEGDRNKSSTTPGTKKGIGRILYVFENEMLVEIINRTVHCFWVAYSQETHDGYKVYLGVYVKRLNWFTPFYMFFITPMLDWIIYPSMKAGMIKMWKEHFAPGVSGQNLNETADSRGI